LSYQTKEQAIGYILKAVIDTGSSRQELREVYLVARQGIKEMLEGREDNRMDNMLTNIILMDSLDTLEKDKEYSKKAEANLYDGYDRFTVEEAGDFFKAFAVILK